jgi:hypothetical protein
MNRHVYQIVFLLIFDIEECKNLILISKLSDFKKNGIMHKEKQIYFQEKEKGRKLNLIIYNYIHIILCC